MTGELSRIAAILVVALAAYGTRLAGPRIGAKMMAHAGLAQWLKHLGACVIAAFVAPALIQGDNALRAGVVAACCAMALTARISASMFVGAAAAALARTF